ncbi:hypothetical protein HMPREF3291_08145 [Bacillus sp. HMSC76G11]|nr:hypothetical protein HMPREF3291_08145 [Bacillus sp. HMSC76G11]
MESIFKGRKDCYAALDKDPTVKALFANTFGFVLAEEPERFHSPSKRKILYFLISSKKNTPVRMFRSIIK